MKTYPAFNEHASCKGHANAILDYEFEKQEDRDMLVTILDKKIADYEKNSPTENP